MLFLVALAARSVSCDDGAAASDAVVVAASDSAPTMHTIFSTECNAYFDWQSLGLMHSHRAVGQKGGFTRLMACDEQPPPGVHIVPDTHVHPNYAVHPRTKDRYAPYNKPFSIMHWLEHAKPTADFIIVLDADMIFRTAMTAAMLGVERGRPISAHYGYLVGVFRQNHMKVKARVPNVENAQQVGGFTVMHREDLERVAPRWLYWTEEVRQDPDSWANTGDIFNGNGKNGPPWISEMYGYVFACAEARVDFKVSNDVMLYPGYQPPKEPWPAVLHYGITYHVDEYAFDKHWYMGGGPRNDFTTCPGRVFDKPPDASALLEDPGSLERRRKEVALVVARGLYDATKWWSREHCGKELPDPPHRAFKCSTNRDTNVVSCKELRGGELSRAREDERARGLRGGARARGGGTMTRGGGGIIAGDGGEGEKQTACGDDAGDDCCGWARDGECEKNPGFMLVRCAKSCDACGDATRCDAECCPPEKKSGEDASASTRAKRNDAGASDAGASDAGASEKAAAEVVELGVVPDALGAALEAGDVSVSGGDDDARRSLARGWSPPAPVLAFGVGSLLTTVGVRLARGVGSGACASRFGGGRRWGRGRREARAE